MEDIALLGLGVTSDPVVKATKDLKAFEDQAGKTEKSAKGLEGTTALLAKAMGLLGAAFSVTQLIRMTSVWTDLNSRVRNAVSAHESATDVLRRIDEMARRTYSSLEQTADSYLRNASALKALGYTTSQQLDLTESLNNALVVSAIKGQAAESVMTAWSKAMALGKLNGDNLNTIIMSGGRVAEALADSMGVSVLELRKLGEQGKITGKDMFGVTSQLEKLREEAEAMPATAADGLVLLGNALLSTVGRLDEALGASSAFADVLILVGDNADALIPVVGALAAMVAASLIPAILGATAALAAFALTPIGLLAIGIGLLAGAITYLWNQQRLAEQTTDDLKDAINTNSKAIEIARTASQNFRQDLRDQIAVQLKATAVALAEANAQALAARAKAGNERIGFGAVLFGDSAATQEAKAAELRAADLKMLMKTIDAQLAEVDQIMTTKPGKDTAGGTTDPTKDQVKAAEKYDDLVKATERRTASLVAEAEAMGLTGIEAQSLINLHELMAAAEATGVEMTEPRIEQLMRLSEAQTDAELTLEGLQMKMENRSPWETMAEEMERVQELLDRGKIGWDDYAVGVGKSAEKMVGSYASGANDVLDNVEKLTDALGLEGKKAFEVQKALGIARAVVSGAESVTHSFNAGTAIGGPPLGFAFAGIALAATAAQIASLASTSYESKSVPGSAGSAAPAPVAVQPAAQAAGPSANITIYGDSLGRKGIEDLVKQIQKLQADRGGNLNLRFA